MTFLVLSVLVSDKKFLHRPLHWPKAHVCILFRNNEGNMCCYLFSHLSLRTLSISLNLYLSRFSSLQNARRCQKDACIYALYACIIKFLICFIFKELSIKNEPRASDDLMDILGGMIYFVLFPHLIMYHSLSRFPVNVVAMQDQ